MWVQKIKEYLGGLVRSARSVFVDLKLKWSNLRGNNMSQAIDYFELGMLDECHSRLRIILKIWPNSEYANYLLGLLYVCSGNGQRAVEYLSRVNSFKYEQAQKLLRIVEANRHDAIAKKYLESSDLNVIENEIKKITL